VVAGRGGPRPVLSQVVGSELELADFRDAMAHFASGVTVVTTVDETGRWWGFTASSFCSVSLAPPLVLVLLADTAESYPAFSKADRFAVSILARQHEATARRFATRGADKFAGETFRVSAPSQPPVLSGALASLECEVHVRQSLGDHLLLVGRVIDADATDGDPLIHYGRSFHRLECRSA
jgi:flavin reductase ActVB